MPYKPKKKCSFPGCHNLTSGHFCDEHARQANRDYNKQRLQRDPDAFKRFGRRWREIRDLYISKHPLCERCLKAGHLVPATEVHHIVDAAKGGGDEEANLMSLCKSCHSSITLSGIKNSGG